MEMAEESPTRLFDGVVFAIIPGDDLGLGKADSLVDEIDARGGRFIPLSEEYQTLSNLDELTHIISTHVEFPQYNAALEHGVHIVKPSWVMSSISKGKAAQPRQFSPDPSQYFHDVTLTCGDVPQGDEDAIIAGVIALGGNHSGPLSKLVTHIVTNSLDDDKCQLAMERDLSCKIVLPHWFDDCFKLGRKINEKPYLFPDPEILQRNNTSKVRDNNSGLLEGATVPHPSSEPPSSPPVSPSKSRKNLNALMGRKIKLGDDLQLSQHLRKTLKALIEYAGAILTTSMDESNLYICQYREGEDYVQASRKGTMVANLSWLYHVINRNRYSSPLSKLLHYPVPREGLPGFEGMRISISNYTGDARMYVENLIRCSGAEYTKTMKQDNTHLITATMQSEKCEAAQEWGINIVNHIWLEESYAKCAAQVLTNPRYTHFPARTNLGEVAGQTSFDMKRVEQMFFAKPKETPRKVVALPASVANARNNVPTPETLALASTDIPTPVQRDDDSGYAEPSTSKRQIGRPRKSASTPRVGIEDKENESPFLPSTGRASKNKALGMLHQQAGDIALFQKEMKRKGGVTHGGRRSSIVDDQPSPAPEEAQKPRRKRKSDEATYEATAMGDDLSDGETQAANKKPSKKAKHTGPAELPPIRYRLLVTGDERWISSKRQEDHDKRTLRQLGVLLMTEPKDVQILVAPRIMRTKKFVCALADAPIVVDTTYLDAALEDLKLPPPPLLQDTENEARYGMSLSESLARAKINNHRLFHGWTIYITKAVAGGFETYQEIVSVNGGNTCLYAGRRGLELGRRVVNDEAAPEVQHQGGDDEMDVVYLVSGDSSQEKQLWKQFRELAMNQGLEARVVRHDWLLDCAMRQQVVWNEELAHE